MWVTKDTETGSRETRRDGSYGGGGKGLVTTLGQTEKFRVESTVGYRMFRNIREGE